MKKEVMNMRASNRTSPIALAGAIITAIRDDKKDADVACIGAGAVNQTMKAIAVARGMGEPSGIDVVATPYFAMADTDGEQRTILHIVAKGY